MSSILGSITSSMHFGRDHQAGPDLVAADADSLPYAAGDQAAAVAPSRYPARWALVCCCLHARDELLCAEGASQLPLLPAAELPTAQVLGCLRC